MPDIHARFSSIVYSNTCASVLVCISIFYSNLSIHQLILGHVVNCKWTPGRCKNLHRELLILLSYLTAMPYNTSSVIQQHPNHWIESNLFLVVRYTYLHNVWISFWITMSYRQMKGEFIIPHCTMVYGTNVRNIKYAIERINRFINQSINPCMHACMHSFIFIKYV